MNESEQIELVNRHAEALNEGRALNREGAARQVGDLLDMAHRVHATLKPLAPRAAFVKELKQKLVGEARTQLQHRTADRQHWLLWAAGLGALIYIGSVMVVGVKASLWVLGILATLLGWKKEQTKRTAEIHAGRRR